MALSGPFGLEWARPAGLWALLFPVLVLIASRMRSRPPSRATGTLHLWREVSTLSPVRGRRTRRRIPPPLWFAALALALGAVALGGPRRGTPELPRVWAVHVDVSPSMGLRLASGETRLAASLASARAWLAEHANADDRVRWSSEVHGELELALGADVPAWSPPRYGVEEPRWELFDQPGTLWVRDRADGVQPTRAGLFASGGPAVPGPVAVGGRDRYDWDGSRVAVVAGGARVRRIAILDADDGRALPEPLRRFATAWAAGRGFELETTRDDARETDLVLELTPGEGPETPWRVGRERWSARGLASRGGLRESGTPGPRERWLTAPREGGGEAVLVEASPGRVRVAWTQLAEPEGDPAAFAVSWGRLFDRWSLPAEGVVPLGERADAGHTLVRAPERAPAVASATEEPALWAGRIDAWLAAGAAMFAVVALSAGLGRKA